MRTAIVRPGAAALIVRGPHSGAGDGNNKAASGRGQHGAALPAGRRDAHLATTTMFIFVCVQHRTIVKL